MWVKSSLVAAALCNTMVLVSAWKFDDSCGPSDNRKENLRGAIEYLMQWPEKVNNHLGSDKDVNTYAENIFNSGDFDKVKTVINAVGKMNKEGTSDTMDPIIYCDEDRLTPIKDVKDPNKPVDTMKDTIHGIKIEADDCSDEGGKTLAYTMNFKKGGKKHAYIQLCRSLLKKTGQKLVLNEDKKYDVKKLNSALSFMRKLGKPTHIDHFSMLHMTIFHEFVHTWKVQEPDITDDGGYEWDQITTTTRAKSLDNADSFAYTAMGTWLIKKLGAKISNKGEVSLEEDELARRDGLVGVSWFG